MRIPRPAMALVVTTVAVALTLTACSSGSGSGPAASSAGPEAKPSSLTVWTWTGAPGEDAMKALATAYEAKTGIKVDSKVISRDNYKSQVQLALNSGESVDVLGVQPSQFALDVKPQLTPVSSWVSHIDGGLAAYTPSTIEQSKRLYGSDELYSVPFGSSGSAVCFYNADMLTEIGVKPPETWDDMAALTTALKAKKPGVLPLVAPAGGTDGWFQDELILTMVGQTDPGFFNKARYENGKWNTDSYAAALDRYGKLFADGTLDRAALDLGYADAMNAFNTGKAAIACNGTWEAGMLKSSYRTTNGLAASSIGVMPLPADKASTRSLRSFLDITWGIPTTAKSPGAAADFIAFATTGDGVNLWAEGLGFVPAKAGWKLDTQKVFGTDTVAADGYTLIQKLIGEPSSDRNNLSALSAQAGTYVLEVAQGRMTGKDAAAKVQADVESGKYS